MKKSFGIVSLTVLAAAGWLLVWKLSGDLSRTKDDLSAAMAKSVAAENEWARVQEQLRVAKAAVATASKATPPARQERPSPSPGSIRADGPVSEGQPEYYRRVVEDPEVNRLFVAQQKLQLRQQYDFLLKKLHLTADEEAGFLGRLAEKRVTSMDVANVAAANGLKPNDPAVLEGFDRANAESDQAIRALIGDERFAQYREFDQNIVAWSALYGVSRDIALSGSPLDFAQAEALTKILVQPSSPGRSPVTVGPSAAESMQAYAVSYAAWTDAAIAQAAGVLNAAQLAALKRSLDQTLAAVKLRAALQRPATKSP